MRFGIAWVLAWLLAFLLLRGSGAVTAAVEWVTNPPAATCSYVAADGNTYLTDGPDARGRC